MILVLQHILPACINMIVSPLNTAQQAMMACTLSLPLLQPSLLPRPQLVTTTACTLSLQPLQLSQPLLSVQALLLPRLFLRPVPLLPLPHQPSAHTRFWLQAPHHPLTQPSHQLSVKASPALPPAQPLPPALHPLPQAVPAAQANAQPTAPLFVTAPRNLASATMAAWSGRRLLLEPLAPTVPS